LRSTAGAAGRFELRPGRPCTGRSCAVSSSAAARGRSPRGAAADLAGVAAERRPAAPARGGSVPPWCNCTMHVAAASRRAGALVLTTPARSRRVTFTAAASRVRRMGRGRARTRDVELSSSTRAAVRPLPSSWTSRVISRNADDAAQPRGRRGVRHASRACRSGPRQCTPHFSGRQQRASCSCTSGEPSRRMREPRDAVQRRHLPSLPRLRAENDFSRLRTLTQRSFVR
jgi:hypothetical protein